MKHMDTRSLGSLVGTPVGLMVSYVFPLIAGAVLGVGSVYLAVRPQWADQTWLLFAARRMLDGGRIGFDIAEENPPLIIWLSTIPVAIGRALDIPLPAALQGWVTALVAFSVLWSAILLRLKYRRRQKAVRGLVRASAVVRNGGAPVAARWPARTHHAAAGACPIW